jgi:hypothetical protein
MAGSKMVDGWDAVKEGDHYVGKYTWPDGRVFEGRADWVTSKKTVHKDDKGFSLVTEDPTLGHYEFTGSWFGTEDRPEGKGKFATAPFPPPDPDDRGIKAALDN